MQKLILLGIAAACITTSAAQKNAHEPYWLNPSVNRIGPETPRADFLLSSQSLEHSLATKANQNVI